MDRILQDMLKSGFDAPEPVEKRAFIRTLTVQKVSNFKLLCTQARYIRKSAWLLGTVLFIASALTAMAVSESSMWILSALMPLLSLTVISESGRSESCGMAELELSARFNLKTVFLARLIILGAADFIMLCAASVFAGAGLSASLIYIFCPYIFSAAAGLFICRKIRSTGEMYLSAAASFLTAGLEIIFRKDIFSFYLRCGEGESFLIFSLMTAALVYEGVKRIKETEELKWSLE